MRVVYYFHSDFMPLYLLTLYTKADRSNISKSQKAELAKLTHALVNIWRSQGS